MYLQNNSGDAHKIWRESKLHNACMPSIYGLRKSLSVIKLLVLDFRYKYTM